MDTSSGMIEVERRGNTLVLTPQTDLRELESQEIEQEMEAILRLMKWDSAVRNVVVDFGHTDYFGSTALGFLVRLRQQVRERNGRMAFCNVSAHEEDILDASKLSGLWRFFSSREKAVAAVDNYSSAV